MASTCKYYKQQKFVSYDSGNTWSPLNEFRRGDLYEEHSADCGYEVIYKWENVIGEYTCSGCTMYQKIQKYASYDGGTTWSAVSPAEYGIGDVIELGSTDCGCSTQYRWYTLPSTQYICSGYTKYYKEVYQVSYDNGNTWANVVPEQTRMGDVIESASTDCGYSGIIYKWDVISGYTCVGVNKYEKTQKFESYDNCMTWSDVIPAEYGIGQLIEMNSYDCGGGSYKMQAERNDGSVYYITCNSSTTLSASEAASVPSHYTGATSVTSVTFGDCTTIIGDRAFYNNEYPKMITVNIGDSVQRIGSDAFFCSLGLKTVNVGSGVTSLGTTPFRSCSNIVNVSWNSPTFPEMFRVSSHLKNVTLGNNVSALATSALCGTNIEEIDIPNSVVSISDDAFRRCTSLVSCDISDNSQLTYIGAYAFDGCSGLTSINIPSGVTTVGTDAFRGCSSLARVSINCSTISGWFSGFTSVTALTLGNNVSTIGNNAFSGCRGLRSVSIPQSVTTIGRYAFSNCIKLTNVIIPSGVTSIGRYAFSYCSGLTSVTVEATAPPTLSDVSGTLLTFNGTYPIYVPCGSVNAYKSASGWSLYASRISPSTDCPQKLRATYSNGTYIIGCDSSTTLTSGETRSLNTISTMNKAIVGNCVTEIGVNAFSGATSLSSLTLDNGITTLGNQAFMMCSGLTSFNFPSGLTRIDGSCFRLANSITSITVPSGVTYIGSGAFADMSGLTAATIPSSVAEIRSNLFLRDTALKEVHFKRTTAPIIAADCVKDCTSLQKIYIPTCESFASYAATEGLSAFTSYFYSEDTRNKCT